MLNACLQCCIYYILSAMNIRFNTFFRIIFRCINLLDRSRMNNHVNTFTSTLQAFTITNITYKKAELGIFRFRIFLFKFKLLQFITRIDNNSFNIRIIPKDCFHKLLTERTCSTGN